MEFPLLLLKYVEIVDLWCGCQIGEQRGEIDLPVPDQMRDIADAPDRQRILIGDEAERPGTRALQPRPDEIRQSG